MTKKSVFDKPFVDFPDLIDVLKKRGLTIINDFQAIDLLKDYGYYKLINGYKKNYQQSPSNGDETFIPGATMDQLFAQFVLDSQFQELFLTTVFPVENHFKNLIGYEVAKKFGVNNFTKDDPKNPDPKVQSYLHPDNYTGSTRNDVVSYIHNRVLDSDDNPVAYYKTHKNHIPPWIMMSNMTLGSAVRYFQILPKSLKTNIVQEIVDPIDGEDIGAKKELVTIGFEILRQFRNASAHSNPLYLYKAKLESNPSPRIMSTYIGSGIVRKKSLVGRNDLFSALLFLLMLTQKPVRRSLFIQSLQDIEDSYLFDENDFTTSVYNDYLINSGLPVNYIEQLRKANVELTKHSKIHSQITVTSTSGDSLNVPLILNRHPSGSVAQEQTVWVTKRGKSYHHSKECAALKTSSQEPYEITLIDAQSKGLTKCKREK
ncbi:Abi family protein [Lacticaseibacillus sharpeae]|nr:Abi family protein [Lacticaseibacillus sharpeae]